MTLPSRLLAPVRLLAAFLLCSSLAVSGSAAEPDGSGVLDIGSRLEPLFDTHLIDRQVNVRLEMHRPVAREVSLVHDEPWEGNTSGYHTVLQDGDTYRMYYRGHAMDYSGKLKMAHSEVTCYAESKDGIHWTKPKLGLFAWEGSKENNIVWHGRGNHNFSPFIDTNPACPPEARYKAIGGTHITGLIAFQSADGIHWSEIREEPVFTEGAFDSQNVVFWNEHRGRYDLYFRFFTGKALGAGLRSIGMSSSDDFLSWNEQRELDYSGSPPQQMYTNQVQPYFRAPHVLVAFPTRYVARELTEHVRQLPPLPLRTKMTDSLKRVGSDLTDVVFMTSRDGLKFNRWDEAFLRPGPQGQGQWMYGDQYLALGLVETAPAIEGGPREVSLYNTENSWRENRRLRRYSLRTDGFVSVRAPYAGGEFTTRQITFKGRQLQINYATSAAGSVKVEIQHPDGRPVRGFSLADSAEMYGDSINHVVTWQSGSDVSQLAGMPVRVRFVLSDADL
ncbi:MAG: hypothetical protein KDA79_19345, partial [Planctomycetaceae bacterium]|nr:hypothetical protein [Planctomycetaceae bacterium]